MDILQGLYLLVHVSLRYNEIERSTNMSLTEETLRLHNGVRIPCFGLDTISFSRDEVPHVVTEALKNGIRHIETASSYGTEEAIGAAIRASGIARDELFLTDEISGISHPEATARSALASLRRLGVDYLDLLLLGWNGGDTENDPANANVYKAWKGLESLYKAGSVHAIGIVDFLPWQIEYLLQDVEIAPMCSLVGLFPGHPDIAKFTANNEHLILTIAYLPKDLGKIAGSREIQILAQKHSCRPEDIIYQYLAQKNCAITLRCTELPEMHVTLQEDEMQFLDAMRDYTAD